MVVVSHVAAARIRAFEDPVRAKTFVKNAASAAGLGRIGLGLDEKDGLPRAFVSGIELHIVALRSQSIEKLGVRPALQLALC